MAKKVKFTETCKHDGHTFTADQVVEFSTAKTGSYFVALGAAEPAEASDTPDLKLGASDIFVDPNTVWATGPNRGKRVL